MLELSGGVGSLPQVPRWNADRRARSSLPSPHAAEGGEIGRAAASVDADGRFTRLSAFRLPDLRAGRDLDGCRYHRRRPADGIGPGFSCASWSNNSGARAPRGRFVIASASEAIQPSAGSPRGRLLSPSPGWPIPRGDWQIPSQDFRFSANCSRIISSKRRGSSANTRSYPRNRR